MEQRTTDIYIYNIYIYENSTVVPTSVGLPQARPNYCIHKTLNEVVQTQITSLGKAYHNPIS